MTRTTATGVRAARTLAIEDLAFDGFPDDGRLWWLRWVDYGAATGTSRSSFLHLLFSALPDGTRVDALPLLDANLAARSAASHRSKAHVGWLPVLRVGLVIRAGKVVGQLGAEVWRFRFRAPRQVERVELLLRESPAAVDFRRRSRRRLPVEDTSFEMGDRPGLLSASDYPLPGVRDGRLLCFGPRRAPPLLLMPCAEVVRVAYAPHAALARAIIDHSWERQMSRVLDVERTGALPDGSVWQVAPRVRLRAEHIAVAANLALNPVARRRANLVHYELMMAPGGVLTASLPFEWEVLELVAACIRLRAGVEGERWFGYAIEGLRWPPPPRGPPQRIVWVPGSRTSPRGDRRPDKKGRSGSGEGSVRRRPQGRVVLDGDPGSYAPLAVVAEGTRWTDDPVVIKEPRPLREMRSELVRVGVEQKTLVPAQRRAMAAGHVAAAEPRRSRGGPAAVDPQSVRQADAGSQAASLFEEVSTMLGELVVSGALESAEVVPAAGADLAWRGDVAAWAFPCVRVPRTGLDEPSRRWYIRDFAREGLFDASRKHVRRAALVLCLVGGGRVAYWLEIEPRGYNHDSYRSLIVSATGAMPVETVIRKLLEIAAERTGVWPDAGTLRQLAAVGDRSGIGACALWRHQRLDPPTPAQGARPEQDAPERLGPLSAEAALTEVRKVLAP